MSATSAYAPSREDFEALLDQSYGQNDDGYDDNRSRNTPRSFRPAA